MVHLSGQGGRGDPQGESITLGQPKASGEEQKMTRFFEAKKTKMLNTGVGILLKYSTTP